MSRWRVIYGESGPSWHQDFATKRETERFCRRCIRRGDVVYEPFRLTGTAADDVGYLTAIALESKAGGAA